MRIWDDAITERDRLVYEAGGFGKRQGFGKKPALVIIDVTYNFTGDKPEPILESMKRFPQSCGQVGWEAVHHIARLLPLAREHKVPVIYTLADTGPKPAGWLSPKGSGSKMHELASNNEIIREITPSTNDIVIRKRRASIFYGTPLTSILNALDVDTLLVCGCTTSGCIRASVDEAYANNFRVTVIEEATFDRAEMSHKINLFDMNAKYADVVPIAEVREFIMGLRK